MPAGPSGRSSPSKTDVSAGVQSLRLLQDVRERRAGNVGQRVSQQLVEKLPTMMALLIDDSAHSLRVQALVEMSDVIARIQTFDVEMLRTVLDEIELVTAVVLALEAAPLTDEALLIPGLVVLSNVALALGPAQLARAGAARLLTRLICGFDGIGSPLASPPLPSLAIRRYAAAALCGLTREREGREAVPLASRGLLMKELVQLADDPAAHRDASRALSSLRRLRSQGGHVAKPTHRTSLADDRLPLHATRKEVKLLVREAAIIDEERRRQRDALDRARLAADVVRRQAARRLQFEFRLRRDAKLGVLRLQKQREALSVIARISGGRNQLVARRFVTKLRGRVFVTMQERLAQTAADLPSEEA